MFKWHDILLTKVCAFKGMKDNCYLYPATGGYNAPKTENGGMTVKDKVDPAVEPTVDPTDPGAG